MKVTCTLRAVVLIGEVGEVVPTLQGLVERRQGARWRRARPVIATTPISAGRHAACTGTPAKGTAASATTTTEHRPATASTTDHSTAAAATIVRRR